jgi:tRNA pseudouridine55 synthase
MDGLLIIDKPEGPTSHDIVARVRRLYRLSRVGHTGTLDPLASGVLPLVLGRATRLARFLTADRKRYEAVVRLGQATDTYDRLGEPVGPATAIAPDGIVREVIEAALARFRGDIVQTPPAYSAKKIGGEVAYRLARRGEAITPAPVPVTGTRLELIGVDAGNGCVTLDIECSAGFYVRSLAHDLGIALGCGGHLTALRRTASGEWTLDRAVAFDDCERDPERGRAAMVPMSDVLAWMVGVHLTGEGVRRVGHGQSIRPEHLFSAAPAAAPDAYIRLLGPDGALLALARPGAGPEAEGILHPVLVLV